MLEAEKTHHIEIKGEIPSHVIDYLKHELGDNVSFEEDIELLESEWFKKISQTVTPADSVKIYRQNMKLTQKQLGERLGGLSAQKISDIENGRRNISASLAKRLSEVLKTSSDRFI